MRTWRMACTAAVFAIGLATSAHADEWTKLTYLTFSGPVNMPGITLPSGTYRFELMDPDTSRRVIRVSDKDGSKNYGIFLTISDQKMEPSNEAVVMFREQPAGAPQAVRAWFYPGETHGYEFVYPHDQAMKIAKASHQSVLSMNESKAESTTEADRVASMRSAEVGRVDDSGKAVSSDEQLKDSSRHQPATTPAATTTASTATTTASAATTTAPAATTTAPAATTTASAQSTTAPRAAQTTTAPPPAPQTTTSEPAIAAPTTAPAPAAVGTSGTTTTRRHLPGTASPLPFLSLLSGLSIFGALGARTARKALQ